MQPQANRAQNADHEGELKSLLDTTNADAEKHLSLISSLPKLDGWTVPHRLYKGYWIPEDVLPGVVTVGERFRARSTDIIVASLPKSGTTWLKGVAFATAFRDRYAFDDHPLLKRNSHNCVISLEYLHAMNLRPHDLEEQPPPRVLATHIPYSLLPSQARDSPCRIIYVCREPKDVFVSLWNYMKKMKPEAVAGLNEAFELFAEGGSQFGPSWDHNLEYWNESRKRPEKVLLLKYEEMMAEPAASVRKIAEFIGRPFTEAEEKEGVVEKVVELCSFEKMSGLEVNKTGVGRIGDVPIRASVFFREGKVGDWVNFLSGDMGERLDRIVREKLEGSGLTFGIRPDSAPAKT